MPSIKLLEYKPEEFISESIAEQCMAVEEEKTTLVSGNLINAKNTCEPTEGCVIIHEQDDGNNNKQSKNKEKITCGHSILEVTCGEQAIQLSGFARQLEIVSGFKNKRQKIDFKITDITGPCSKHTNKTFDVKKIKQESNEKLSFEAESIPFYKVFENGTIFPWKAKKSVYSICSNTCNGSVYTQLVVYPDLKIAINVPFDFKALKEKRSSLKKKHGSYKNEINEKGKLVKYKTDNESNELFSSYTEDGKEWKISKSFEKKYSRVTDVTKIAKKGLGKLTDALGGSIEIDILLPSGNIEFEYSFEQLKDAHLKDVPFKVDSQYKVVAKLKPLMGAKANIHLDEAAVYLIGGPAGKFYAKIKRMMEKAGIKFGINLIITGTIEVELGFKKLALEKEDKRIGAGLAGQIEVDLKALASYEKTYIITAKGTAEAGIKTGIRGEAFLNKSASNINLDLVAIFLGVQFYYMLKLQLGDQTKKHKRHKKWYEIFKSKDISRTKTKYLVAEKKWPKSIQVV